ncbi:MAG: hypothetical protein P5702_23140 [Limnospira sp. PMC 1291.21]|uniref:hypothetical protein n=1 Tax=Limnospira TaxID=2596745 RepID=UPI00028047A7|nr:MULTISPECIES: hypothetical protein [Limnospira]EKD08475.1 hypothetical protein SPLC1_S230370 [Arthrospira platensis C1]QJB24633.1 hypothetical protein HFV01_01045 [Limnospira fusiformis SAG 85.79]MDT9179821.1 hypothetical protein [Limnospira sp. PMC 1238.20]MDT9200215.1 hypothetical protein [Limnospira sp. PMC 1042.18]MDT9206056.1 hypothetical protein [Limnospira sp. PMC 1243.20]
MVGLSDRPSCLPIVVDGLSQMESTRRLGGLAAGDRISLPYICSPAGNAIASPPS